MKELEIIKYLLLEIEEELEYEKNRKQEYKLAQEKASDARDNGEKYANAYKYLPKAFIRMPSNNKIKENAKIIRRLLMKFY